LAEEKIGMWIFRWACAKSSANTAVPATCFAP